MMYLDLKDYLFSDTELAEYKHEAALAAAKLNTIYRLIHTAYLRHQISYESALELFTMTYQEVPKQADWMDWNRAQLTSYYLQLQHRVIKNRTGLH